MTGLPEPTSAQDVKVLLEKVADSAIAAHHSGFFKTGKGEYGEGDKFHGIRVPVIRGIAKSCDKISQDEILKLLHSEMHEERLLSLIVLVDRFRRADETGKEAIFHLYMDERKWVNNWDLVDSSASYIAGAWLLTRDKSILFRIADSHVVWDRRIAIISTHYFIRRGFFETTLKLSEKLLNDPHDLIQKAVGWMLRETGKQDEGVLRTFLDIHSGNMPRTMLRYAIERLREQIRQEYLTGRK